MAILKESWHSLTKPSSVTVKDGYNNVTKSVIVMEPFARGFGTTLGNALRRVLLSSINGFAVTAVKIEGVLHEYSAIDGVKEDVLDIIMNLKSLAITKSDSTPSILKLSSNKPGPVYAGSIETPAGVEIINKDLLICTLNKGAKIDMQMNVEFGKGYAVAEQGKKTDRAVGTIMVDSIFSPVKKVSYRVENARVGQITDFELEQYIHLRMLNEGFLITPFHNMALISPDTTYEDVDSHTAMFEKMCGDLTGK